MNVTARHQSVVTSTLCVVGNTAAGIAASLCAARHGVSTTLVGRGKSLGGVFPSLGALETHYRGSRSPIVDEFCSRVLAFYADRYGATSEQYTACSGRHHPDSMMSFEPHVAEAILAEMVDSEPLLTTYLDHHLIDVERSAQLLVRASFVADTGDCLSVEAETFIDATDEGDLAAQAGLPYRIGREARAQFDETHAGRLFTRFVPGKFPEDAAHGRLNLIPKWTTRGILQGSTGEGDDNVQDYSYRLCLTDDRDNRIGIGKPLNYDRSAFAAIALDPPDIGVAPYPLHHRFLTNSLYSMIANDHLIHGHQLPNRKRSWNATNFTGGGRGYAEGSAAIRREIESRHYYHAVGILYFLQTDESVPPDVRDQALKWGLAADEFTEAAHIPPLYVREGRRIVGKTTFTEHDNARAAGLDRAPIHYDSIAITEFPSDSLACTAERMPGTLPDGQMFLSETSCPGQVPYRVLLSEGVDNLLTATCCSATHVAWGSIRTTPTQIQIAEAAACAAVLAASAGVCVSTIDTSQLQRHLVSYGSMLSFFNDFDMRSGHTWVAAVQYLGAYGYFASYDSQAQDPLTEPTAQAWTQTTATIASGGDGFDPNACARALPTVPGHQCTADTLIAGLKQHVAPLLAGREFDTAVDAWKSSVGLSPSRGAACELIYAVLNTAKVWMR